MIKNLAVFRVSASSKIGGGHVARCLSLAAGLSEIGWDCVFASESETAKIMPIVNNYKGIVIPKNGILNETSFIEKFLEKQASILIVDHYQRGRKFQEKARSWAKNIMVIDDLANRPHDADLLLDQSGGRAATNYSGLVSSKCKLMLGPKFSLLRKDFSTPPISPKKSSVKKTPCIFISMGATDENNLTTPILKTLLHIAPQANVDILLSNGAPHIKKVKEICAKLGNVKLHVNVPNPVKIMSNATFAIGTTGINLWERCALGLPSIIFAVAENQLLNASYVVKHGGGILAGSSSKIDRDILANSILKIIQNGQCLETMATAARKICDGKGVSRVVKEIILLTEQ